MTDTKQAVISKKIAPALVTVLALLWGVTGSALAQTPITARVDRTTIAADEQLVLTVTVTGDFLTIPRPDLSQIEDFVVVNSSTSTQVSIVNGKMTSQGVYIYRVQPLAEGALTIAPISINLNGQVYQTDPIDIEVLPAGTQTQPPAAPDNGTPSTTEQDFFVEAEVDNDAPYLGEQVIYVFRFYQAVNFFGQPDYRPPAFTDFWSRQIIDQPHYNRQVNGKNYLVTEIRTALFPANLGQLTIDPARLVIPGGMFEPDIRLESDPVTVIAKPLPDGAPPEFSGSVGEFEIRARLNQQETKINEPLTLVIEIEGEGNIETITEPTMPDIPNWRFFDSQASSRIDSKKDVLSGIRSFERLVVPGQAGQQEFPSIQFTFYNPKSGHYETVRTGPIPVNILPDDNSQGLPLITGSGAGQQSVGLLATDIQHIKPAPASLNTPQVVSVVGRVVYWSAWIMPLFAIGGAWIWKRRQLRLERDPAYARSIIARKRALAILSEAQVAGEDVSGAAGRALLGFLSDKLDKPTTGLTIAELTALLQKSGVDGGLVARIKDVLLQVDVGRYAPISAGDEKTLVSETRLLINELEKSFGGRG
ncbi:MAG: hypothetical protein FOGNACKC_01066 [Anaerolineae bacterium]|nr:hypothetical protein [Anaerolineae bacterium]